jgi:excisionase family DNA binding protein
MHAYRSAEKDGAWLTMSEAAAKLGVTNHAVRRLIKDRILPAEQVVRGAPYQIRASDLDEDRVAEAVRRKGRPCRIDDENQMPMFQILEEGGCNEHTVAIGFIDRSAELLSASRKPWSR